MNEFEKDILSPEEAENEINIDSQEAAAEEEAQEIPAQSQQEAKADVDIREELEQLKDMFQQELDKSLRGEDDTDDGMLIQELDEITEDADEDAEPENPCECCGERPCSEAHGEGYPYCDECRELMKRYPLRAGGIIASILMIISLVAGVYFNYSYMEDVSAIVNASSNYKAGYVVDAMYEYYNYFNGSRTGSKPSMRAVREAAECYKLTGYMSDAADIITTYYSSTALKMPWNINLKKTVELSKELSESYYAITAIVNPALSGEKFDYDKMMADLEALRDVNPLENGTGSITAYNEIFIEYYKYVIMSVNKEPIEAQLEQLKKIDEIGKGYEWSYLANYCSTAALVGDKETVDSCFDRIMEINRQDTAAYNAKASYYRFLETPDADAILDICKQAQENAYANDYNYYQYYTIGYLLKGEGALAMEKIEALMKTGSYSVQGCNLYALCGLYTGDESIYTKMSSLLSSYGYEISELVTAYKNGEMTLIEVLQDKGGDI